MIITLKIDNETFNVLQCRYVFNRKIDSKGHPLGGMKGGDIFVTMESTQNNMLFEEFVRKDGQRPVSGSIDFFDTREGKYIRTIEFEEAYIYALGEHMARYSHLPMTQTVAISPLRLDINNTVRIDRRFPQTYAFWWDEYKPEEMPAAVEEIKERYTIKDAYWMNKYGEPVRCLTVDFPVTLTVVLGEFTAGGRVNLAFEDKTDGELKYFEYSGNVEDDGVIVIDNFKMEPKTKRD